MQGTRFTLDDLLTGAGAAMGTANLRLRAGGAPALLQQFQLQLTFAAAFALPPDDSTVQLTQVSRPNAQQAAMTRSSGGGGGNVMITATYIAAPALVPVPPT